MRTPLTRPWTLTGTGEQVPTELRGRVLAATVPGCVHTDLLAAQAIPDPYLDRNEADLAWVGRTAWRYSTTLDLEAFSPGEQVDLVFRGLDTVCEVALDGRRLGSPRNMHRTHRFDLTKTLRAAHDGGQASSVDLVVDFAAQLDAAEELSDEQGPRVHVNAHPYNAVRKMACNFGWDWGPDLVTSGIWREVHVERWRVARLGSVRTLVTVENRRGRVELHADVVRGADGATSGSRTPGGCHPTADTLTLRGEVAGAGGEVTIQPSDTHVVLVMEVPDVDLWWPRGHGEQPLHDLVAALESDGQELDRHERRIGFRSVTLETAPDEHGTAFTLLVNDRSIFVKGANWIPDDCFPSRVDRARYAGSIGDAVDAGMNLLRVWGGGIYESEEFYDLCDELGVLVWQDFLFACAAYAEEPPLSDEVVAEAREAVTRLGSHASLVVWNGNNESLWGHVDWGWAEQLGDATWGRGFYLDILPRLLAELDPTRPYSPGSPWSFDEDRHPNDPAHGTTHVWDVWNERDYTAYRDWVPRFVSEFGYQGPPTWATLTRAVHDTPLTPASPGMLAHQKAADGDAKLTRGLAPHLDVPTEIEDWHWAMSVQQARAVAFGVEHFRSWQPVCMGVVLWQLNDCWPVTSWSAVDGDGRRKPLWYAVRQAYADRLLTIQPRPEGLSLFACNDTDEPWSARIALRRLAFDGTERAVSSMVLTLLPRSSTTARLADALLDEVSPTDEVLVAETDRERALWFFEEDRQLALVDSWETTSATRTSDGYAVKVTAKTLQRDVSLLVDKVDPDAVVDEMMLTLLPGESHTFAVDSARTLLPERFLDPRVLRSTNQLVHS